MIYFVTYKHVIIICFKSEKFRFKANNFTFMDFRNVAKQFNNAPFTRQVILHILKDYKRPNDKISELIMNGELILLKKGFYIPGKNTDLIVQEPFLIANY